MQRYWYPQTDRFGKTKEERIYVSGDGAFVHGGASAAVKGKLAATDIAAYLTAISAKEKEDACHDLEKKLRSEHAVRPFVDAMYRPRPYLYKLTDDVIFIALIFSARVLRDTSSPITPTSLLLSNVLYSYLSNDP